MKYDTCITIFGGTGDLTFRKLLPALYTMSRTYDLSNNRFLGFSWKFSVFSPVSDTYLHPNCLLYTSDLQNIQ